jgi:MinD superfamily P-loop ATPase
MKSRKGNGEHSRTAYIRIDNKKCKACWKCKEVCSKNVIGRINLPWHKHIRIVNGSDCTGCLKCVKVCAYNALSKVS